MVYRFRFEIAYRWESGIGRCMHQTKIELKNLAFFARHGLMKEEATLGQRFRVDVRVLLDSSLKLESDTAAETVNYVELYAVVKEIFEGTRFNFIESCADTIARQLLVRFDKVMEATVVVKKPSVPVDCICDYFAAEVTRCR